jgi:pimeloyl-ACP methyl ester carboxylesterase
MPYANLRGQNLYFEDTGGDDPALIFSHGLLMDHEMFAPQVDALRAGYRCITWDERGHGLTAGDHLEPFSYYDSADDLAALLAHLGIERAVLAGMSQGGYLSLRCALRHPQIVRALILIDTQALPEDALKMPGYKLMLEAWSKHGLSPEIAGMLEHIILGEAWSGAAAWKAKWQQVKPHNLMQCFATLGGRDDISDSIGAIEVPALVIHGDKDFAIALDRGERLAQSLPKAELVVVEGGGHASNLTHPDIVNPAILKFLRALH